MAAILNFSFYRGQDTILAFTMDPVENITGWALRFSVKAGFTDPTELISKTTVSGIVITNGPAGEAQVTIASADTACLGIATYVCDLQRTDIGHIVELAIGTFELLQMVNQVPC